MRSRFATKSIMMGIPQTNMVFSIKPSLSVGFHYQLTPCILSKTTTNFYPNLWWPSSLMPSIPGISSGVPYRPRLQYIPRKMHTYLQWRNNERNGVSNLQPHDCLLNCLLRRRSKKTSKLRGTGEFPAQRASNEGNVSMWWRHQGTSMWCDISWG